MKRVIRKFINKLRGSADINTLIKDGLKVGKNFRMNEQCIIDPSHCWLIEIGNDVVLAPRVHILAHDASMWNETGYAKIAPVKIGNNVFIGAGSILLPGVTLGDNVVVGAGSVVTKSFPSNTVVMGNPAKAFCSYDEFISKHFEFQKEKPKFDESFTARNKNITDKMKDDMNAALKGNGFGYVV